MVIRTLVENTSNFEGLRSEHGLSLYIETKKRKILFDTGASMLFAENAVKLDVNLSEVEIAVISHGHHDHGGGLKTFLELNHQAKVYLNDEAFGEYYAMKPDGERAYIGLDGSLLWNDRLRFVGEKQAIDEGVELFSDVRGDRLIPSGNKDLLVKVDGTFRQDDFAHEQNLIIKEDGKTVLVAGCAHRGIVNILEHYFKESGAMPDYVIGGFHLFNRSAKQNENPEVVARIGECLIDVKSKFYTCHCTGFEPYNCLKAVMGGNIEYLSTGSKIVI